MEGNQYRDTRIRELQAGKNILLLLKIFILIVIIIFLLYSTAGNAIFTDINEFLFWPLIIIYIIYRFASNREISHLRQAYETQVP